MNTREKRMPEHANSFLAGGILAANALFSIYKKNDPLYIKLSAALSFLCIADGLHELHNEGRLKKALGLPFFQKHLIGKRSATPGAVPSASNEKLTPRSRL